MEEIRWISLKNNGGFVVKMRIHGSGEYESGGFFPIGQEKTVDLADAVGNIKDGDEVWLEAVVKLGKNNKAKQRFVYRRSSGNKAGYSIKGTTLNNSLSYNGIVYSNNPPVSTTGNQTTTNTNNNTTGNQTTGNTNNNTIGNQTATNTNNNATSIRELLAGVQYRPADLINNELYNDKTIYPDAIESLPDRDAAFILTKNETHINNKEIYVRGSGYEKIYPGALLLVDTNLFSGNPNPLGVKRSKISVYGDFLAGGNPTENNIDPNNMDVRMAANRIMEVLLRDSRYKAPGMQQPTTKIYTSEKSLMMDLAVDASFAGCSLKVSAKTDSKQSSFIHATTLNQDYFTVKLKDDWMADPSSLFDKSVTVEQLRRAMNGKAIAIVTSVTYGRTFSYLKEYSAKKYTFDSSQHISGYGQTGDASQNVSEECTSTNEDTFNLGGTALSISVLNGKKSQAEIEQAMATNMEFGRSNQGVVTKYTLQLVTGTSPGIGLIPSFNGTLYEIEYDRCPRRLSMYVNVKPVRVGGPGGGDVEVHLDVDCFRVMPTANSKQGEGVPVIFKRVREESPNEVRKPWYDKFNKTKTKEFGDLEAGEYIYKDPKIRIKSRASKWSKWTNDDERRLSHGEIQSGEMTLYLKGDVAASVNIDTINEEPKK